MSNGFKGAVCKCSQIVIHVPLPQRMAVMFPLFRILVMIQSGCRFLLLKQPDGQHLLYLPLTFTLYKQPLTKWPYVEKSFQVFEISQNNPIYWIKRSLKPY